MQILPNGYQELDNWTPRNTLECIQPRRDRHGHGPGAENENPGDNQLRQQGLPPGYDLCNRYVEGGIVLLTDKTGSHEVKPGNGRSGTVMPSATIRIGKAMKSRAYVAKSSRNDAPDRSQGKSLENGKNEKRKPRQVQEVDNSRAMEGSSPLTTFNLCISPYAGPPHSKIKIRIACRCTGKSF